MLKEADVRAILNKVEYLDWKLYLGDMGNGWYVQVQFEAQDADSGKIEMQHCRKWYISPHMTKTEIVATVYKAVEAAVLHEMKESFKYCGMPIHNPHTSIEALVNVCMDTEHRKPPTGTAQATINAYDYNRKSVKLENCEIKVSKNWKPLPNQMSFLENVID